MTQKVCKIEDCVKAVTAKGMCAMHYRRFRLYGDPLYTKEQAKRSCRVSGCDNPHYGNDLCRHHYDRLRSTGSLDAKRIEDLPGEQWVEVQREKCRGIFVSNMGRLKSCRKKDELLLKTTLKKLGKSSAYYLIASTGGTDIRVHQEVLKAFTENEHDDSTGVFKDGNPANCRLDNLEWYGRNYLIDKAISNAEQSDHALADCFLKFWHGEHDAVNDWLESLQDTLRAYLYKRLQNYSFPWFLDLDDCVQQSLYDIFIALYRAQFPGFSHLTGWVIRIASAALSRNLRLGKKRFESLDISKDGGATKADINEFCHPSAELQAIYNEEVLC